MEFQFKCPHCGSGSSPYIYRSGPHLRMDCSDCYRYIKFISPRDAVLFGWTGESLTENRASGSQGVTNKMSTLLTGSICLTDLLEHAKKGHSAFSRSAKNQKVYVNFTQWLNDEPDQYGNHSSFNLNSTKEKKDAELAANAGKKIYFGNAKIQEKKEGGGGDPVTPGAPDLSLKDLPF